jgi:long-chain acyl-CoA synthetase
MLGYWGQPEASAAAVDRVGWLHTGDQAGVAQGHLYISGRIKDLLVLSTGEKVAPADLEGAIVGDSLFSQVLAVGEGRPFLAALAVPEPGALALLAAQAGVAGEPADGVPPPALEGLLIERMNRRLKDFPAYAKIRRVALVARPWTIEDGSMTPTMKLKRARILARHRSELAGLYAGHR